MLMLARQGTYSGVLRMIQLAEQVADPAGKLRIDPESR